MQFPHQLFQKAGFKSADVGALYGVSRVTGHRWLKGACVNIFLQDRVTKLIAPVTAAVAAGALPDPAIAQLPPKKRVAKIKSILNQHRMKK